jgi:RluA family pseudouridine synthase
VLAARSPLLAGWRNAIYLDRLPDSIEARLRKLRFVNPGNLAERRLDDALTSWLPDALGRPVSKAKARKLIMAGAVYLNGRPVRIAATPLAGGARVEAHVEPEKLFKDGTARDQAFALAADRILFEDEDLIVVDKPPGLPAHPTLDKNRDNLLAAVKRFLSKRDGVANPYLGVHQRLDRDTSGVVLFTKSQRVNAAVSEIFSKRRAVKIYQALTAPRPARLRAAGEKEWTVQSYLGKISHSKPARYGSVTENGNAAETSFRIVAEYRRGTWIEAVPRTGRTHQIRVQLAEHGLPILGDDLYGADRRGADGLAPRLMLHAAELKFPHPVSGNGMSVESPLPLDFKRCLRGIQSA